MSTLKSPSYDELKRRLEAAESALTAIREGGVETILGEREALVVRLAETRQEHLRRVLSAIRKVNQLIVTENDPRRLVEQACVNLTETMGYHNAWIALLGGEAARGLGLETEGSAAAAGFDGGFEILRRRLESGEFPECMAQALAREDVFVVGDPLADCPDCPLSGHYGGRAGLVRRLEHDGVTWGILTASVPAAYARNAEEQDLFNEVAGDLAFALYKIAAARRLEENRRDLEFVIEGAGVGTWKWNAQTGETVFNERWADIIGYTLEEISPVSIETWIKFCHPDDLKESDRRLQACFDGRSADYRCECRMKHKDGHWVWVLDQGRVMTRDDAGKPLTIFGTHTDITQIKQTEEALRTERELSERLIEDGPVGITKVDCDGRIVFANRHAERIFGLKMSETLGRTYDAPDWRITAVDGSTFPEEELPFRRVIATDRAVYDVQHAIVRGGGDRRILSINGAPLHDAQGQIEGVVFAILDITEHHAADKAIEEALLRQREAVKAGNVGLWDWDLKTDTVRYSAEWKHQIGYAEHEIGDGFEEWESRVHPDDLQRTLGRIRQYIRDRTRAYQVEFRFRHKDGSYRWILAQATVLTDEKGEPIRTIGSHIDITQRKQAEEALRESEQRLQAVFNAVDGVPIQGYDKDRRVIFWNPASEKLYGYTQDEAIGQLLEELIIPEASRGSVVKAIDQWHVQDIPIPAGELELLHKNGEQLQVYSNHVMITNQHGVKEMFCIDVDLTETRRIERRMASLAAVVENSDNIVVVKDLDLRVIATNQAFAKAAGHDTIETMIGKTDAEIFGVTPDTEPIRSYMEDERCAQTLPPGEYILREEPLVTRDGEVRDFLTKKYPIYDPSGSLIATGNISTDITNIKQAELALRESERRVRAKLDALLDPEGDIGRLHLADVVDCDEIQSLMNDFHALTDIGVGIIDLDGKVVVGTGWQDVCTKFHRVHPETEKLCRESDTELTSGVEPGTFKIYKCKNNLWDMVTPITIGGKHVGNLFLGQFFLEEDEPEIATFREQARRYGFDEEAYLEAYLAIPRWSRETVDRVMTFYCNLVNVISRMSFAHIKLARATEALRKSETLFQSMLAAVPDMISIHDTEMNVVYSNWNGFAAVPPDRRILGEKCYRLYRGLDNICPDCKAKHVIETGKPYTTEVNLPEGGWYELNVVPLLDAGRNCELFVEWVRDITERKQAQEELKRKQRFLDLHNRIVTVFLAHPRTDIEAAPLTALDDILRLLDSQLGYFGYIDEAGDLVCPSMTRDVWDQCQVAEKSIIFPRSGWGGLWGRSLLERRTLVANENLRLPEGHVALENALAVPIVHHDILIGQIVVANKAGGYDQEDVELLESAAAHTAPILFAIQEEARQKSAYAKLEAQLRQAQKMEAVGQLAGGIAHDFNNLLQVIETNLDLAGELIQTSPSDATELIEAALKSERRGAELTQKLLVFSRKQALRPHRVCLNDWLAGEVRLLSRTLGEDIEIRIEPTTDEVTVDIDEGLLSNAILNIALNARAAMPRGGTLKMSTSRHHFANGIAVETDTLPPGDYVEVAVSDTGIGMSEETLQRAFEPFFTTKNVGEGSGLGLSMVFGLARQSGGTATIESELDKGTTVRILIPAAIDEAKESGSDRQEGSAAIHATKVLLVEDDADVRKSTVRVLRIIGCEVTEVESAAPVAEILKNDGGIELLVSDVVLPGGVNGVELATEAVALRPDLKVILVSGYPDTTLAKSGLSEANYFLLPKPFSKTALSEAIATVMGKKV